MENHEMVSGLIRLEWRSIRLYAVVNVVQSAWILLLIAVMLRLINDHPEPAAYGAGLLYAWFIPVLLPMVRTELPGWRIPGYFYATPVSPWMLIGVDFLIVNAWSVGQGVILVYCIGLISVPCPIPWIPAFLSLLGGSLGVFLFWALPSGKVRIVVPIAAGMASVVPLLVLTERMDTLHIPLRVIAYGFFFTLTAYVVSVLIFGLRKERALAVEAAEAQ